MSIKKDTQKGAIITLSLVFGTIFLLILSGLLGFILLQLRQSQQKAAWANSLHIAEAGADYYKWHLSHNQNDVQDGETWCCATPPCNDVCGPYEHTFYDVEGQLSGSFTLEITAKRICDEILGVYITSTGSPVEFPNSKRKVRGKYASMSVAEYSYLLNDSVWAGGDRQIYGKYHSNGGVRMDGGHNSSVTSSASDWICTGSFGCCRWVWFGWPYYRYGWDCSLDCPDSCTVNTTGTELMGGTPIKDECACPGVLTTTENSNPDLFNFPITPFNFNGLTADLLGIKTLSQNKGKYFPPSTDLDSNGKGYHLILKNNGAFDIKIITDLGRAWGYNNEEGWHWDYHIIQGEIAYQTEISLPETCGLIFTEDNLWIEGTTKGKITVASANLIDEFEDTGVVINGNLEYTDLEGSDSLSLITEKDILIPLYSPDDVLIQGVFVTQKGRSLSRNHYSCSSYPDDCKKNDLTIYGSVISNKRVGTKWTYSGGGWASGYNQRYDYFDQKLSLDPPPLLPYVSEDIQFISWEEIQ